MSVAVDVDVLNDVAVLCVVDVPIVVVGDADVVVLVLLVLWLMSELALHFPAKPPIRWQTLENCLTCMHNCCGLGHAIRVP